MVVWGEVMGVYISSGSGEGKKRGILEIFGGKN